MLATVRSGAAQTIAAAQPSHAARSASHTSSIVGGRWNSRWLANARIRSNGGDQRRSSA